MIRRNSINSQQPFTVSYSQVNEAGTVLQSGSFSTLEGKKREVIDENHPGFKKLIRSGALVMGNYAKEDIEITLGKGGGLVYSNPAATYPNRVVIMSNSSRTEGVRNGYRDTVVYLEHPDREKLAHDAQLQALANVDASPYHLMEDYLELHKTMSMLGNPLKSLLGILPEYVLRRKKLILKLEKKRQASLLTGVGRNIMRNQRLNSGFNRYAGSEAYRRIVDASLAAEFGVRPLVKTIADLTEYAHRNMAVMKPGVRRRSTAEKHGTLTDTTAFREGGYDTADMYRDVFTTARATVFYHVASRPTDNTLTADLGLRIKDIPVGLWNIVPYSFLVDRIIDVQSMVKAAMNLMDPQVTIEGACLSMLDEQQIVYSARNYAKTDGSSTYTFSASPSFYKRRYKTRSSYKPSLTINSESIDPMGLVDSCRHISELAGLATQLLWKGRA